jgi:hypothetical protein
MTDTQTQAREVSSLAHRTRQRARRIESGQSLTTFTPRKYTREDVLAAYHKHGNLKAVCAEIGCQPYNAYIIVQTAGMLRGTDRVAYGTMQSIAGRSAEDEFKRLVPDALDMNAQFNEHHPGYDFDYRGIRIDVKFSTLQRVKNGSGCWSFFIERYTEKRRSTPKTKPDMYVLFATEGKSIKDGYKVYLFPFALLAGQKSIRFQPEIPSVWHDFEIAPDALAATLADAALAMGSER